MHLMTGVNQSSQRRANQEQGLRIHPVNVTHDMKQRLTNEPGTNTKNHYFLNHYANYALL